MDYVNLYKSNGKMHVSCTEITTLYKLYKKNLNLQIN